MARTRAIVLTALFVLMTLVMMPVQFAAMKLKLPGRLALPLIYHKTLCRILGIRVRKHGEQVKDRAVLVTANHTSYFDIPILASCGKLSFIAKSEVAAWPFFGQMAKLQRTVFVERARRSKTSASRTSIQERLVEQGDTLVLFPEGTSSDGNRVLPFKSALMSAAELSAKDAEAGKPPITVQPVSVAYTRLHGIPMGRQYRPHFAWYGDMELVPHLIEAFMLGPIDVDVHYHPPVTIADFGSRKALAAYCHTVVEAGVGHALAGRPGVAGPWFEDRKAPAEEPESDAVPAGAV